MDMDSAGIFAINAGERGMISTKNNYSALLARNHKSFYPTSNPGRYSVNIGNMSTNKPSKYIVDMHLMDVANLEWCQLLGYRA